MDCVDREQAENAVCDVSVIAGCEVRVLHLERCVWCLSVDESLPSSARSICSHRFPRSAGSGGSNTASDS